MADYFALLSRAVASLNPNSRESREALYNRARAALFDQLRAVEPPWSDAQIKAETASLESAIGQIESEARRSGSRGGVGSGGIGVTERANRPRRQIDAAENADAGPERRPRTTPKPFSPVLLGVIGALVLAVVAAGSYAYLARSKAKPAVTADRTGGSAPSKPAVAAPATPQKTVSAAKGKAADIEASNLSYELRRQLVFYRSTYPPGTIIIDKSQHVLYQVRAATVALRYSIAIGPTCQDAAGLHRVSGKDTSPVWPPAPSGAEHQPDSRLGTRILYLTGVDYGIHGTDKPNVIGRDSPFGCFLLADDDINDLYNRTPVDTRVVVTN